MTSPARNRFAPEMRSRVLILVLLCLLPGGCANKQDKPEAKGYLATHIENDGSKMFVYSLDFDRQKEGRKKKTHTGGYASGSSRGGMSGGATVGSSGRNSSSKSSSRQGSKGRSSGQMDTGGKLQTMLEREFVRSGYCRDGFTEIQRETRPPLVYIKGECKETATKTDLERFPNEAE